MLSRLLRHPGFALLIGAFITLFGVGGLRQVFGVFLKPVEADLASDRAQIALVAGIALMVLGLGQPLAGRLVDRHGPGLVIPVAVLLAGAGAALAALSAQLWQFALLYGLVAGLGFAGTANAPVTAAVARRFMERRTLAIAVCSAGAPLGQFLLAPGAGALVSSLGWRLTLGLIGTAILLLILPVAWVCLRNEPASPAGVSAAPGSYLRSIRSRPFLLMAGSYFICGFTTLGLVHTHLVAYAADLGAPEAEGARLLGLVALFNVAGLLAAGHAGDRWGPRSPLVGVFAIRALALLWAANAGSAAALLPFTVVFGLTDMATIPLIGTASASAFGRGSVGGVFGLLVVCHQVGAALGAYAAGLGYTLLGSYQPVYFVAAALAIGASGLSLALPRLAPRAELQATTAAGVR